MFVHKLVFGVWKLRLDGNLPQNLREMWRQKNGRANDPLLSSILCHIGGALFVMSMLGAVVLTIIMGIADEQTMYRFEPGLLVCLATAVVILALGTMTFAVSMQFHSLLTDAQRYLNLSLQDLGGLSREGLGQYAEKNLKEAGSRLREAELRYPSFDPETEKLRAGFKTRYNTFLTLGMIRDVGYGPFIPTTLPK